MTALLRDEKAEERTALQPQVQGATQERMLREMAEALEALTAERCLLIVLEDLHWSDSSTLELLSFIAQRREPARLLVIATYRPADVVMHEHPLRKVSQELKTHGHSAELALELLSQEAVAMYTANRLSGPRVSDELTQQLYQRTDGNALFMVTLIDYYWQHGLFVQTEDEWQLSSEGDQLSVPDGLRPLLEKQIEGLSEEDQLVLEVASVAGTEFTVAAVAAGLKQDVDALDDIYEGLAGKGQLIEERGLAEWPDGTLSGQYGFRHALYQNVLYDRIAAARQARLHRTIGERIEAGYGKRGREVAAELAVHFERGRDTQRAIQYRQQADQFAAQRSAYPEAVEHLTKGIAVFVTLPDSPERVQQELFLQTSLSSTLGALKGFGTSEVGQALSRAYVLSQQVEESPQLFPVFSGLAGFSLTQGEIHRAYDLAQQGFRLAQSVDNKTLHLWSHLVLGQVLLWHSDFVAADEHLTPGLALYDP